MPSGAATKMCIRDRVKLLKNEGVGFTDESHVDMARFCVRALPYIAE